MIGSERCPCLCHHYSVCVCACLCGRTSYHDELACFVRIRGLGIHGASSIPVVTTAALIVAAFAEWWQLRQSSCETASQVQNFLHATRKPHECENRGFIYFQWFATDFAMIVFPCVLFYRCRHLDSSIFNLRQRSFRSLPALKISYPCCYYVTIFVIAIALRGSNDAHNLSCSGAFPGPVHLLQTIAFTVL